MHDIIYGHIEPFDGVALGIIYGRGCLLHLQNITELMPDGVLELHSLVAVDPYRASKLGNPGVQYGIFHGDGSFVWYSTVQTVPIKTILYSDIVQHPIRGVLHWFNQVDVKYLSRKSTGSWLVLALPQAHFLNLYKSCVTFYDSLLQFRYHSRPVEL